MSKIGSSAPGRFYAQFTNACLLLRSPFLLLVRLYWGWQFAQTGWGKLHHLPRVIGFFRSLGIPAPGVMAPLVSGMEFVGGILLILGLVTHITGLVLAFDMFVAYWTADRAALHAAFSSDPSKFYAADPYTFFFAALIAFVFGAGLFSLDALIQRRRKTRS